MAENKIIYEKQYTRDFSIIMEEAWDYALTTGMEKRLGIKNTAGTYNVYYISDGVVEVWGSVEGSNWLLAEVLRKNKKNNKLIPTTLEWYNQLVESLNPIFKKGCVETIEELRVFLDQLYEAMVGFAIIYHTALDKRSPKAAYELALRMREEDILFDSSDKVIRASLLHIDPSLKGYETVILRKDVDTTIPNKQILVERKKHFVVIPGVVEEVITLQEFSAKNPEYTFIFDVVKESAEKELIGQIAFQGKVEGRVRIMKRKEQIHDMQEEEILVSPMTTPDFLPAMKKAAALVTDEGGITCHAAIVSRELQKPCVIGTKIATQVLHDGDLVEVDADKGIVKILEKHD